VGLRLRADRAGLAADLEARGFRAGAGALFVWEGVLAYIDDAAIDATLAFTDRNDATRLAILRSSSLRSCVRRRPAAGLVRREDSLEFLPGQIGDEGGRIERVRERRHHALPMETAFLAEQQRSIVSPIRPVEQAEVAALGLAAPGPVRLVVVAMIGAPLLTRPVERVAATAGGAAASVAVLGATVDLPAIAARADEEDPATPRTPSLPTNLRPALVHRRRRRDDFLSFESVRARLRVSGAVTPDRPRAQVATWALSLLSRRGAGAYERAVRAGQFASDFPGSGWPSTPDHEMMEQPSRQGPRVHASSTSCSRGSSSRWTFSSAYLAYPHTLSLPIPHRDPE
jgi:hypothetical protein